MLQEQALFRAAGELLDSGSFHQIITANALLLLEARRPGALKQACQFTSLTVAESAGACWAVQRLGAPRPYRIAGIDLALRLCEMANNRARSVFLLGGRPGVAKEAAEFLKVQIPRIEIAGAIDGFYDPAQEAAILRSIQDSAPALLLVAMGMPRQETWIFTHRSSFPSTVCIGVGGTFDVWSGRVQRAPARYQDSGLEWWYRLKQEPWRWSRIAKLPVFALRILLASWFG